VGGPDLDAAAIADLVGAETRFTRRGSGGIRCVAQIDSTNAELVRFVHGGGTGFRVLIAEQQDAGHGRFSRPWRAPIGTSLLMSVLVPVSDKRLAGDWGWLSMAAGLAVTEAVETACGAGGGRVTLKWPNDVLLDVDTPHGGKLCGILSERVDGQAGAHAVIGMGLNVSMTADQLPVPTATSLALCGLDHDRHRLAAQLVLALDRLIGVWLATGTGARHLPRALRHHRQAGAPHLRPGGGGRRADPPRRGLRRYRPGRVDRGRRRSGTPFLRGRRCAAPSPVADPRLTPMTSHILAMGGGGFSMSNRGAPTALDRYLLDLSGKSSPLVCFAPTAAADDPVYINRFLAAYSALGVRTMVLTLWQGAAESVDRLSEADVVLSGGGSAANLVALWRAHGVDHVIRQMVKREADVVLAGVSAGAACWFAGSLTDSFGDLRAWRGGLGLLPGSFCPHFDGEPDRPPAYAQAIASGVLPSGYAVDDGAAVHFVDKEFAGAVSEREGAEVSRFTSSNSPTAAGVLRDQLEVTVL
jgi:biotin-[acetyl-CoA-carboxylase] ligase BirA-like protein